MRCNQLENKNRMKQSYKYRHHSSVCNIELMVEIQEKDGLFLYV
jgi:hypothetical protein